MAVLVGPDHRFACANPGYSRLVGGREVLGRTVAEAVPEAVSQGFVAILDRVYRTGEAYVANSVRFMLEGGAGERGREAFLDIVYQPLRNAAGQVTGIFVEGADVTQRTLQDRALRESETRLRVALDAGELGDFEWDLRADNLRYSQRTGEIFGFEPGEGHRSADYFARCLEEDRDRMRADVHAGLAKGRMQASYRIRLPDAAVRHIRSHGRVLLDEHGAPERVVGVVLDETERQIAAHALSESEARLQTALGASGMVGLYDWHIPDDRFFADARFARLFGVDPDRAASGAPLEEFKRRIHPADWPQVDVQIQRAMQTGEAYEAEYRLVQDDGEPRWVVARGRCLHDAAGVPSRFSGTVVDVTARRLAEERQTLLSREVDHRARNALAVVRAALRLTKAPDLPTYVQLIEGRVAALARAQTLLSDDRWAGADLLTLLRGELDGFLNSAGETGQRATLSGPTISLPPGAAQPLAMAIHELATNAVKYGALYAQSGRVAVTWALEGGPTGRLRLQWTEEGGPPVDAAPTQRGFGARVLDGTIRTQLGGIVTMLWKPSGLVCDIEVPLGRNLAALTDAADEGIITG